MLSQRVHCHITHLQASASVPPFKLNMQDCMRKTGGDCSSIFRFIKHYNFLLSVIQHLVQMLAIALASMRASRTQPTRLGRICIQSFRASYAHSICVTLLAHVVWSLLPFAARTNRFPFDQGIVDPLPWWCHCTLRNSRLRLSSRPVRGNIDGLLLLVCAQHLRNHISDVAETRRLARIEFEG